jgi:DNA-3-methyladenine glycosylase
VIDAPLGATPPLPKAFYTRDVLEVARDLLGRTLCRRLPDGRILRGRIVEVEAYLGLVDRASHAYRGKTPRNAPMFQDGGIAYVYFVYGMHHCLNVVTSVAGHPTAVLLRAATTPNGTSASGPGRLTRAFAIDRRLDGASLLGPDLWLEEGTPIGDREVHRTARIGIDYAGGWARRLLRYVIRNHPEVSGPRHHGRPRSRSRNRPRAKRPRRRRRP